MPKRSPRPARESTGGITPPVLPRLRCSEPAMGHDPATPRFELCGVPVSVIDMDGLVRAVERRLRNGGPDAPGTFICFRDAHGIIRAQDDAKMREAHREAFLIAPDGKPLA